MLAALADPTVFVAQCMSTSSRVILNAHSPKSKLWVAGTWYEIATAKPQGERWLLSFAGMDDRNIAERLTNSDCVWRSN